MLIYLLRLATLVLLRTNMSDLHWLLVFIVNPFMLIAAKKQSGDFEDIFLVLRLFEKIFEEE